MPGIAGFIEVNHSGRAPVVIDAMIKCMVHEPFYTFGHLLEPQLNVAAGWVCHSGGFSDCMPAWSEERNICLIFWGEHFQDNSDKRDLILEGQKDSVLKASDLIRLYEKHGKGFLEKLNGPLCGIILDLRERKAILFNDRYGLARIYYHENDKGFYFSSEAKSLLKIIPDLKHFDIRGLGEFFSCGCALQGRTLFQNISLLPPGSSWTFRPQLATQKEAYFRKDLWEGLPTLSPEVYYTQLKETFTRILPRYFGGPQEVGLSLTGGLDSRMIIAGAPAAPGDLPCYTFSGMYRESEDVKIGREVANLCHQPHSLIKVDQAFFPQYLTNAMKCVYITDGAMDVSAAVGLYVNKQARLLAPIRLTGNYGSEILRKNIAFKPMPLDLSALAPEFAKAVRDAARTYAQERHGNTLSFIAFKQVPWHHFCRFAEENSQLTIRSPYLDNELVRLAFQAPPGLLLHKEFALRYCSELRPSLSGAPTDRGVLDRPRFVPEKVYQLWKERWPKAEYYFDYGMPPCLTKLDRLLASARLERLFLGQQKYYHYRIWYRRELSKQLKEVMLDSRTLNRPYLNGKRVKQLVDAHTQGKGNYTLELHKLMTIEFIERQLFS